jgi:hypothetical protein
MDSSEMGKLGGPARSKSLTPEQRQEIARKAGLARWEKERQKAKKPRAKARKKVA